jgi:hypothetical protein
LLLYVVVAVYAQADTVSDADLIAQLPYASILLVEAPDDIRRRTGFRSVACGLAPRRNRSAGNGIFSETELVRPSWTA